MSEDVANTLASYAPWLLRADEDWRLRIVLHDFGLVWYDAAKKNRLLLVEAEPPSIDNRWDAFLAAYVEHHCWHDDLTTPSWVFDERRYLSAFWFPGPNLSSLRVESIVHSPAAFEAHGILLAARELTVV